METSKLSFWSGMAAMATGIFWMLWTVVPWSSLLVPALLLALPVIYGLQQRRSSGMAWWSWAASLLAMAGAATSAVTIVLILRGADGGVGTLDVLAHLGLVALAGGLALLGLSALHSTGSSRLIGPPLMLGGLIAVYAAWFWLFMLNRPDPPMVIVTVWVVLGVIIGIGWGYLGQRLIRDAEPVSSSRA